MSEYLRLARLYLVLLAIFTIGRWIMGVKNVPYEKGHHVFSIVILTMLSCLYYAAFVRRWRGYKLFPAVGLTVTLGVISQVVILLATALSYGLGMDTYFTHPTALNVEAPLSPAAAMLVRLQGLIGNSISCGIVGSLGWAFGGLLPEK
jgi:hypothetical protein